MEGARRPRAPPPYLSRMPLRVSWRGWRRPVAAISLPVPAVPRVRKPNRIIHATKVPNPAKQQLWPENGKRSCRHISTATALRPPASKKRVRLHARRSGAGDSEKSICAVSRWCACSALCGVLRAARCEWKRFSISIPTIPKTGAIEPCNTSIPTRGSESNWATSTVGDGAYTRSPPSNSLVTQTGSLSRNSSASTSHSLTCP